MSKIILFFTFLIVLSLGCKSHENKVIQVKINKNIETLFILYTLVDIGMPPVKKSLCEIASQEFNEFKHHNAVRLLDTLIKRTGIDEPVNLILHFSELPGINQLYPIDKIMLQSFSSNNNADEGQKNIDEFIKAFSDFYTEAKVESFISNYKDYYKKAITDVNNNIPQKNTIKSMEDYYGKENIAYFLNPSPVLYPGFGFGSKIETADGLILFNTFGALNDLNGDSLEILFDFNNNEEIRNYSVHEFGHSFINPIANLPLNQELIGKYSYLFSPIQNYMNEQAYRTWETCVIEHIVRLGEIRIAYVLNDFPTASKIRKENIEKNKFIYLPNLERKIIEYEKNREKYKTFEDFFPELIKVFSEIDTTKVKI